MNFDKVTRTFGLAKLYLKEKSPQIAFAAGCVGMVTGTVLACKATTKAPAILDEHKEELAKIKEAKKVVPEEKYSQEDYRRDLTLTYVRVGTRIAKLYLPAVVCLGASMFCFSYGQNTLQTRLNAMSLLSTKLVKDQDDYRNRVKAMIGEEAERRLYYGTHSAPVETVVQDEEGNDVTIIEDVEKLTDERYEELLESGRFSEFFDERSNRFDSYPDYNLNFLLQVEADMTRKLRRNGWLSLNEVYEALDIPVYSQSMYERNAMWGWRCDESDSDCDCYVDFGLKGKGSEAKRRFVEGLEPVILLEFNVDRKPLIGRAKDKKVA